MVTGVIGKVPNPSVVAPGLLCAPTSVGLVPGKVLAKHLLLIIEVDKVGGLVDINRICWWIARTAVISAKYT